MKRIACLAAAALLAAAGARAQEPDFGAQRERIRAERANVEARFAEEQKACRAKFAVTDCMHRITSERNALLAELRRRENGINDAQRRQREEQRQRDAAERQAERESDEAARRPKGEAERREREERAAEQEKKRAAEASRPSRPQPPKDKAPAGPPSPQGSPRALPRTGSPSGPTAEEAAKNRQDYERRLSEAEAHKAEVRARIARRTKPAASALPAPATPASGS